MEYGQFSVAHVIHGLLAVRAAMNPYVLEIIGQTQTKSVIEGAFLNPSVLTQFTNGILVTRKNEKPHRLQFLIHRPNQTSSTSYQASRIIQTYLLSEAKQLHIQSIESDYTLNKVEIVQNLFNYD